MINPITRKIGLNLFLASFLLCLFLIDLYVGSLSFRGYYSLFQANKVQYPQRKPP